MTGEENAKPISEGMLEPNGQISLLFKEGEKPAENQDLPRMKDLFK